MSMQILDSIKKGLSGGARVYDFSEYGLSDFAGKTSVPEEQLDKILEQKGIRLDPNAPKQVIFSDEITEDMDYITNKIVIIDAAEISGRTQFFSNCLLLYHFDEEWANPMIVNDGGLSINNSVIICKSNNREPMIKVYGKSDLNFKRCTFADCSNCINATDSFLRAEIYDSDIFNCGPDFIVGSPYGYKIEFKDSRIVINEYLDYNITPYETLESTNLLALVGDDANLKNSSSLCFDNCIVENRKVSNYFYENLQWPSGFSLYKDSSINAFYKTCTFNNLQMSILGGYYVNCYFVDCHRCVKDFKILENCRFDNCSNCITSSREGAQILQCCFDKCYNNIILMHGGSLLIDMCKFHIRKLEDEECWESGYSSSIIFVNKSDDRLFPNPTECIISNCIFDYVRLVWEQYLMDVDNLWDGENYATLAHVFNCEFKEWITTNSSHKLINPNYCSEEDSRCFEDPTSMILIYYCKGLDTPDCRQIGGSRFN